MDYLNYKEMKELLTDIDVDAPEARLIVAKSEVSDEIGVIYKGVEVLRLTPKGYIVYDVSFAKKTPAFLDGVPNGTFVHETKDVYGKECTVIFKEEPSWEERVNISIR